MTTYTKQEFYSTGNRGIVSCTVNGKKLNEDVSIAVDDNWNGEDIIKVCSVDSSSVSYQDAEGLIKNQNCGIPITANSLCLSCDSEGSYSFGEVNSNGNNITINSQTKEISDWRSSGTRFIQDTKIIWNSASDSSIVGYDEYDNAVIKTAWRSNDHTTANVQVANIVDDNGIFIPYFPEATYTLYARVANNIDYTTDLGVLQAQPNHNKFMQWRGDSTVELQAIKYSESLPDGYLALFTNPNGNMFEYTNIRNGDHLYNSSGEQVLWNENAHVVRYMTNTVDWHEVTNPHSTTLYAFNNNGYIGIYYYNQYGYVLADTSMFVISIAPIE